MRQFIIFKIHVKVAAAIQSYLLIACCKKMNLRPFYQNHVPAAELNFVRKGDMLFTLNFMFTCIKIMLPEEVTVVN